MERDRLVVSVAGSPNVDWSPQKVREVLAENGWDLSWKEVDSALRRVARGVAEVDRRHLLAKLVVQAEMLLDRAFIGGDIKGWSTCARALTRMLRLDTVDITNDSARLRTAITAEQQRAAALAMLCPTPEPAIESEHGHGIDQTVEITEAT